MEYSDGPAGPSRTTGNSAASAEAHSMRKSRRGRNLIDRDALTFDGPSRPLRNPQQTIDNLAHMTTESHSTDLKQIKIENINLDNESRQSNLSDNYKTNNKNRNINTSIHIDSLKVVSYALAHNAVSVASDVVISGASREYQGAEIRIWISTPVGTITEDFRRKIDLIPDSPTHLRDIAVKLDGVVMHSLDEETMGTLHVELTDDEGVTIGEEAKSVRVLASNQWVASPLQLGLEMLAAFVQPNASDLQGLQLQVSDLLRERTGRSALDGYQSMDRGRVDETVHAAYDALVARDIRYTEPPASWSGPGQKIRPVAQVLSNRMGTCLDLSLAMAGLLEQLGIHPLVWVINGHALFGYWRVERMMDVAVDTQLEELINRVDLGEIVMVEATSFAGGPEAATFEQASAEGQRRLHEIDGIDHLGILDVIRARHTRILPLPSRTVNGDGQVIIQEYSLDSRRNFNDLHTQYDGVKRNGECKTLPPRVKQWKNTLLDLSLRNKLINYRESDALHLAIPDGDLARFEDLISSGRVVSLRAADDISALQKKRGIRSAFDLPQEILREGLFEENDVYVSVTEATYGRRLTALRQNMRTIIEETGSNNLYLTFGILRWQIDGRELVSPLVLVPITLTTRNRGRSFSISIDESGVSTPNFCLLEKLFVQFGLKIPEFEDPVEDQSGIDLHAVFNTLRKTLVTAQIDAVVEERASLSILQFAKFGMWRDLDQHWEDLARNPLVNHLAFNPTGDFEDPVDQPAGADLDGLGMISPISADATQLHAINEAIAGRTFVLEGPPGTGKSQTITNLLAHAMREGKKVLFVAEKKAALEVVQRRMASIGLADLVLELHDRTAHPAHLRSKLGHALELSAPEIDYIFEMRKAQARRYIADLNAYAEKIHAPNRAGLSLYSANDRAARFRGEFTSSFGLPIEFVARSTADDIKNTKSVISRIARSASDVHSVFGHPWGFVRGSLSESIDAEAVVRFGQRLDTALKTLNAVGLTPELLQAGLETHEIDDWANILQQPGLDPRLMIRLRDAEAHRTAKEVVAELKGPQFSTLPQWCSHFRMGILDCDLDGLIDRSAAADSAGLFGRKKARRAVAEEIRPFLAQGIDDVAFNELTDNLREVAKTHRAIEGIRHAIESLTGVPLPPGWIPFDPQVREHTSWILASGLDQAVKSQRPGAVRNIMDSIAGTSQRAQVGQTLVELISSLTGLVKASHMDSQNPHTYVWLRGQSFLVRWSQREAGFLTEELAYSSLQAWLKFSAAVEALEPLGLGDLAHSILEGGRRCDILDNEFEVALVDAIVKERTKLQHMETFDLTAQRKNIDNLMNIIPEIRADMAQVLPARVIEKRKIDSGSKAGRIGRLKREISRQRGGMKIRQLFEQFEDIILQLTPCVLVSPASVAQFFPANTAPFDIVVFDEASQVRVADAIGAMGRGKSVVVVGDSKQMPPTSVAETSIDEEAIVSDTVADEESILSECVNAQVPRQWLSWHYRSQSEGLIAFSNHRYYAGRLSTFPGPARPEDKRSGLHFERIHGEFLRDSVGRAKRTNPEEAKAIVRAIRARFVETDRRPSLGVITFNIQQRDLIDRMLRDLDDERITQALEAPDGLFVKNLENVQGDERDVIFFSVAFSKNKRGALPLNFGPLSQAGGERRLNVAITRARHEIRLFCSFEPEELRVGDTSSVGIKHLRDYLLTARDGAESTDGDLRKRSHRDNHRDEIAKELRKRGLIVSTDVGISDFRIDLAVASAEDPDHPCMAILLDGESWYKRKTVVDRDGLPLTVLDQIMGWPVVERVWLPEWLEDRESVVNRLYNAVMEASQNRIRQQKELQTSSSVLQNNSTHTLLSNNKNKLINLENNIENSDFKINDYKNTNWNALHEFQSIIGVKSKNDTNEIEISNNKSQEKINKTNINISFVEKNSNSNQTDDTTIIIENFTKFDGSNYGLTVEDLDNGFNFAVSSSHGTFSDLIRDILEAEGPMPARWLAKRAGQELGLERVSEPRLRQLIRKIPLSLSIDPRDGSVFPPGEKYDKFRKAYRVRRGTQRWYNSVSLAETINAIISVTRSLRRATRDEIQRAVASKFFGYSRRGSKIQKLLDEAMDCGIEDGRLNAIGDYIRPARF